MGAKLVFDDGRVRELSQEESQWIVEVLDRIARKRRLMKTMEVIKNDPDKESPEWWAEFRQFLMENRLNFLERDLGLSAHDER